MRLGSDRLSFNGDLLKAAGRGKGARRALDRLRPGPQRGHFSRCALRRDVQEKRDGATTIRRRGSDEPSLEVTGQESPVRLTESENGPHDSANVLMTAVEKKDSGGRFVEIADVFSVLLETLGFGVSQLRRGVSDGVGVLTCGELNLGHDAKGIVFTTP
jgi:hypothetical protein